MAGMNSNEPQNVGNTQEPTKKSSFFKRAGLVLGLAGSIGGGEINKQKDVNHSQETVGITQDVRNKAGKLLDDIISPREAGAAELDQNIEPKDTAKKIDPKVLANISVINALLLGNKAPIANAGADVKITAGNSTTLDGGNSTDPNSDGSIKVYQWSVGGSVIGTTKTISVSPTNTTTYSLRVQDNKGKWSTAPDSVTVTVEAAPNQLPAAYAGADVPITLGNSTTLHLAGIDSDGSITGYEWSTGGSVVGTSQDLVVSPLSTTTYRGRVQDNKLAWSGYDDVVVTVEAVPNNAPTANAGSDVTITAGNSTTLNGSGIDSDGTITAYEWSTGGSVIGTTQTLSVSPGITTIYSLRVKDNSGAWSTVADDVIVTVEAVPNNAPTANAGPDVTITAGNSTILNGSGIDSDGTITAYEWSTGGSVIGTTQTLSVSPGITTTYSLRVQDNNGAWSTVADDVVVTVEAPIDNPPTGENKTVDIPGGGANSASTTVTLYDPDSGDTVEAVYVGSGILAGDPVISSASASGNTISILVSSGTGSGYIDYKARDNHSVESTTTYRVTFNNLNGN
ncbi:MAG: hypothetical protein WC850_05610 [Candidatus Gracilibacteria bacterium]